MNTPLSFSPAQRFLHWAIALLVFFNLIFSDGIEEWNRAMYRTGSTTAEQVSGANIHAYVGIAILLLALLQLLLRFMIGRPATPPDEPVLFQWAAKLTHLALYLLLFAMPLTGIAAYYFGYRSAGDIHADVLKAILWVVVVGHVLGALAHHFYWKTDVLRRMTIG